MFYEPLVVNNIPYRAYIGKCKSYHRHWHSELELLICLEGQLQVQMEGCQYLLRTGDAIVLPGYEMHMVTAIGEDTRRIAVAFGYTLLGKEYLSVQNTCAYLPAAQQPPELRQCLDTICRYLSQYGCVCPENEWQLRGSLCLLAGFLRTLPQTRTIPEDMQSRIRRLESIYSVLEFVSQHYAQRICVDEAAEHAGYATTYFCKQFKNIIGTSFHQYLTRYRISTACILLEDPNIPIHEVAARTGFSSSKLFCRTFKEITGRTPTQYQSLGPEDKDADWLV